ncbi:DUF6262 family protein [Streptomyces shenzhenensis]|uniref:DUF6262 family protein n=1 Tax=Streptomyces shenzhenensis TaxID=943815 RepID=UPI001F238712|nr:DUF6262 family protein [Streptomyces shenzhenensis]
MTTAVPASRTANALESRRRKTQAGLGRIQTTLEHLAGTKTPITMAAVARHADVSRTFLYEHAEARTLVDEAISRAAGRRVQDRQSDHEAIEASWRERALNAEEALKRPRTKRSGPNASRSATSSARSGTYRRSGARRTSSA